MKIVIRQAEVRDVPAITAIYNEAILNGVATFDTEEKTLEDRQNWLTNRASRYQIFVAEVDGVVVGWASLNQYSDRLAYAATVENSLYVLPAQHGKGLGKLLMKRLLESARENKIHTILARISDGNETSIRLHEKFGFERVGIMREVGIKFGRILDVHLMQVIVK